MKAYIENIKQAAEEAEFQALATIDICGWVAAIARAIARDVDTGGGADVPVLTDLAKYFDDSGATSLEAAFDQFRQITTFCPAPRPAQSVNVALSKGRPTFAERIKLAREGAGLTQAGLAEACGVSQVNICKLETGESGRTSYLPEIARACGVSTDWLAFGNGYAAAEVQP